MYVQAIAVLCISLFEVSSSRLHGVVTNFDAEDVPTCGKKKKEFCNTGPFFKEMKGILVDAPVVEGFYVDEEETKEAQGAINDLIFYFQKKCKNCVEKEAKDELCALKDPIYQGIFDWVSDTMKDTVATYCPPEDFVCGKKHYEHCNGDLYKEMSAHLASTPTNGGTAAPEALNELNGFFTHVCKSCVDHGNAKALCDSTKSIVKGIINNDDREYEDPTANFCQKLSGTPPTPTPPPTPPPKTPKTLPIPVEDGLYHIHISGGTSGGFGGEQILSTTSDGRKVDLFSHDDNSGRQKWRITSIGNGLYHIQIFGGTSGGFGGEQILSTTGDGKLVDLYNRDDNSGRQKWRIVSIGKGLFHIHIFGGTRGGFGGEQILSTTSDGRKVDLYSHDDGSGRQQWKITKISGIKSANIKDGLYHIHISGGTSGGFGGEQILSTTSDGRKVDLFSHDDNSGRQKWQITSIGNGLYHIQIFGGTSGGFGGEQILSTTGDGKLVDLYNRDDNSGRQKWKITWIGKGLFHIHIFGGTSGGFGGEQILSTTSDGRKVDLYSHDDGSGRQQWKITKISGIESANIKDGLYHIHISGGTSGGFGGEQILSTTGDGRKVDLYSHDDNSGRQKWRITSIGNGLYHIQISGGTSGGFGGEQILSTTGDGKLVDLYNRDDNSGRQKWRIVSIGKGLFHIHIFGGTSGGFGGEQILSTTSDGRKVDLYSHDDGSGRQQWKITAISLEGQF